MLYGIELMVFLYDWLRSQHLSSFAFPEYLLWLDPNVQPFFSGALI
jgi:hypothetical protein